MEAMAALSRTVIDEVLNHTQDDILIGHDEHVARGIVRELQMRWERKLSEAYAQIIADKEKLTRSLPGQIHPSYHSNNASSSASAALPTIKIEPSSLQASSPMQSSKRKAESNSSEQQLKKAKVQYESDESSLGTDDESEDEQVEPLTNNLILCQSSKVQNHKGRWKCQFSGGIMNLRGRDYVFRDATGDFRFDKSTS